MSLTRVHLSIIVQQTLSTHARIDSTDMGTGGSSERRTLRVSMHFIRNASTQYQPKMKPILWSYANLLYYTTQKSEKKKNRLGQKTGRITTTNVLLLGAEMIFRRRVPIEKHNNTPYSIIIISQLNNKNAHVHSNARRHWKLGKTYICILHADGQRPAWK